MGGVLVKYETNSEKCQVICKDHLQFLLIVKTFHLLPKAPTSVTTSFFSVLVCHLFQGFPTEYRGFPLEFHYYLTERYENCFNGCLQIIACNNEDDYKLKSDIDVLRLNDQIT